MMDKKIVIAHDFNLKIFLYKMQKIKLNKKYFLKDIRKFKKNEFDKIKIFWGNRLKIKDLIKMKNLVYVHFGCRAISEDVKNYLISNKIKFSVTSKIHVKPIVSTIIAYIFSLARGIGIASELKIRNKFNRISFDKYKNNFNTVYDQNFLIVGYGEISRELVKKIRPFSKKITIINRSKKKSNHKFLSSLKYLKNAVKNKDFIINTLPLTKETKNIFDKKVFKNFKKNSIFINVGRGDTINEKDLLFIKNKKNISLGFDVFNKSNYLNPYFPCKPHAKILKTFGDIFTPHIASFDSKYWYNQEKIFKNKINKINFLK